MIKPRTPPGVMELLPRDQIAFQRMLDVIRRNFERFGFLPVETPVFELTDVLLTKTGGETERQVYFVQSTGSLKQGDDPELALRFACSVANRSGGPRDRRCAMVRPARCPLPMR